jgi:predicted O-methyltransferase YrrM
VSRESLGLSPVLQDYLLAVSLRESETARELRRLTGERDDSSMQIAPEQGQFMAFLLKLMGARRVLEIGTYTGYSALVMAESLPEDGRVVTLDRNEKTTGVAREFWEKAGVSHKIELRLGPARETLKELTGTFDFVFIDADKTNYGFYYEHALKLMEPGGLIVLDNMLWGGQVANPHADDPDTLALKALNQKIRDDDRVDLSLLPVADGITLARKR